MEIRAITVNAAGMAAEQGIQGIGSPGFGRVETEDRDAFGPECRVTISQEGKDLSRRQAEQATRTETGAQDAQAVRTEKMLQRLVDRADQNPDISEKYRTELDEIETKVDSLNSSELSDEDFEKQQKLLKGMRNLKAYQTEQNQKNAKAAREMAMQSAEYQDEIDKNNRELATLLRAMKEAEKAKEERETGKTTEEGNGGSGGSSNIGDSFGTANSAGDVIQGAAAHFMTSSIEREWAAQESFADFAGGARWMIDNADDIARNVLVETGNLRAALEDDAFSDEQLDEMMRLLRDGTKNQWFAEEARKRGWAIGMELIYKEIKQNRSQGQKDLVLAGLQKEEHDKKNPLGGVAQTKKDMMQSAVDADLGVARRNGLNETSREIEEEVKELINERNDVDRTSKYEEEEEKRQEELQEEQRTELREKLQAEQQAEPLQAERQQTEQRTEQPAGAAKAQLVPHFLQ